MEKFSASAQLSPLDIAQMLSESARLLASFTNTEEHGGTPSELPEEVLQRLERSASLLHSAIRSAVGPQTDEAETAADEARSDDTLSSMWIDQGFDGIQGHSRAVTVPEFLSFICSSQKSGILSIKSQKENFLVQVENGAVVYARGDRTPKEESLGQLLLKSGALKLLELECALESRGERGDHLDEMLVKRKIISGEQLRAALGEQVQLLFHRLCDPGDKRFRFFEGLRIETRPRVRLNVTSLLLECARVWDESALTSKLFDASEQEAQAPEEPVKETPYHTIDEHLDQQLEAGEMQLPLLGNAAADLLVLCWEEEVDSNRLKTHILRDQGLCAHLLRIANSVAFAPTVKITSIQLAIARLGLDNIREIALAMTVKQKAFNVPTHAKELRAMWRRASITSGFAKSVCRVLRLGAVRGGLFGLLQDVGKPVVLNLVCEYQERFHLELEWDEIESLMDAYHARVGGRLVHQWQMPDWLQQVVKFHHDYEGADDFRAETMVANLADRLAEWAESGREATAEELADCPVCEALDLDPEVLQTVLSDADRIMQLADVYG